MDREAACGRVPAESRLDDEVDPVRADVGDVCRGVVEPTLRAGACCRGADVEAVDGRVDSSLSKKSSMPPIAVGGG